MIIIDTDVLIEIFDKKSTKGDLAIEKLDIASEDIAITSLNMHEILYGIYKYGGKKISKKGSERTLAQSEPLLQPVGTASGGSLVPGS